MLKGGWWWKSCGRGLNGLYLNDPQDLTARQGMPSTRNKARSNAKFRYNIYLCYRNSLVQVERLGLHAEESQSDDQAQGKCTEFVIQCYHTDGYRKPKLSCESDNEFSKRIDSRDTKYLMFGDVISTNEFSYLKPN